jgi:hypothetical protein
LTPDEGGSGGGQAIIDVLELPTENINENVFYRVPSGSLVINQVVQNSYTVYCVNTLPESGDPATNLDQTQGWVYYNLSDGNLYGYVDDMLSAGLGVPAGWYEASILLGALGFGYSGVIRDILDDPNDSTFRLLLEYISYSYKEGKWTSNKTIGWAGTGPSAEKFNHPGNKALGSCSHAEGFYSHAEGDCSHAEGTTSYAKGDSSHTEGSETYAEGHCSHAEGIFSHAEGNRSHAEGDSTHAVGDSSHAEGNETYAKGYAAHAEGDYSRAEGYASHVEGNHSHAEGDSTHAEGLHSHAFGRSQHVQGEYNISDPNASHDDWWQRGLYAHIVGNGTSDEGRSNAHTLDWDGNAWFAGEVYVGSTSGTHEDEGKKKLATEEFVLNNSSGGSVDAVLYTEQALLEEQKVQARKNIGVDNAPRYFAVNAFNVGDNVLTAEMIGTA